MIGPTRIALAPAAAASAYTCIGCESQWDYADIRNIARCPACGGGLVRIDARPSAQAGAARRPQAA